MEARSYQNETAVVMSFRQRNGGDDEDDQQEASFKKIFVGIILVSFVTYAIVDSCTNHYIEYDFLEFLEWIDGHPEAGFFAFIGMYFVAAILFVPGAILTVGAGYIFVHIFGFGLGILLATTAVFVGASCGAVASFLLGRFLLRDWVNQFSKEFTIFEALDIAFEENGFKIMLLLRLSPIIPFSALNYVSGVTALPFWSYVSALFGILPWTTMYVFLGASAGSLAESTSISGNSSITIVVVGAGILFGFFAVSLTSYYSKIELDRIVASKQQSNQEDGTTMTWLV